MKFLPTFNDMFDDLFHDPFDYSSVDAMRTDIVEKDHVYVISLENVNLRYMDRYYTSIYGDDYLGRELVDTLDYGERVFEVYDFEVREK